jgi:nucleoside-diphosphate-sugar epimerase
VGSWPKKKLQVPAITLDVQEGADIRDCISNLDRHLPRLKAVTHVIHLADVRLDEYDENAFHANLEKQAAFAAGAAQLPNLKQAVFASSCSVYGYTDGLINESSPASPTSWYAEGKLRIEEEWIENKLPLTVFRFGTAYGFSEKMRWDLLPNRLAKTLVRDEEIEIFDPDSVRPYIHVEDFARTLSSALTRPVPLLLNVAESNRSKIDLINALPRENRRTVFNRMKKDIRNYRIDTATAAANGFDFERRLQDGMEELCSRELN